MLYCNILLRASIAEPQVSDKDFPTQVSVSQDIQLSESLSKQELSQQLLPAPFGICARPKTPKVFYPSDTPIQQEGSKPSLVEQQQVQAAFIVALQNKVNGQTTQQNAPSEASGMSKF